jgi:hypothetical protein
LSDGWKIGFKLQEIVETIRDTNMISRTPRGRET